MPALPLRAIRNGFPELALSACRVAWPLKYGTASLFPGIPVRALWRDRNPRTEAALRQVITLDAIRWLYLQGVPDESLVSPETWEHDFALVSRPGNDLVQLDLFADYATNLPLYRQLHACLRAHPVPLLAVWGRDDPTFAPEGALAFAADSPGAEVCLLDGSHFLLESHLHASAGIIRGADSK
jgi:pimeloyl-ACP methyl ester carboxylesterase